GEADHVLRRRSAERRAARGLRRVPPEERVRDPPVPAPAVPRPRLLPRGDRRNARAEPDRLPRRDLAPPRSARSLDGALGRSGGPRTAPLPAADRQGLGGR